MLQFLNVLAESFDHDPARLDKLIAETALGNESAFEELYRSIKASVYGYSPLCRYRLVITDSGKEKEKRPGLAERIEFIESLRVDEH